MDSNNKYLGKEKVSKLLLKFSIPCILSLLILLIIALFDFLVKICYNMKQFRGIYER